MANHAKTLDVFKEDCKGLQSRVQARTVSVRDRERARIVLPAAEIAAEMGPSRPPVTLRGTRDAADWLDGLGDAPRSGAPTKLTQARKDETSPPRSHYRPRNLGSPTGRRGSWTDIWAMCHMRP